MRALGRGLKVFMLQFLKGEDTGELDAGRLFGDNFVIRQTGLKGFIHRGKIDPADVHRAKEALKVAQDILSRGDYDLVILDEIIVALYFELISLPRGYPGTPGQASPGGSGPHRPLCPPELIEIADLVTEMKNIKHYYAAGVPARQGIES